MRNGPKRCQCHSFAIPRLKKSRRYDVDWPDFHLNSSGGLKRQVDNVWVRIRCRSNPLVLRYSLRRSGSSFMAGIGHQLGSVRNADFGRT